MKKILVSTYVALCYLVSSVSGYAQASADDTKPALHRISRENSLFEKDEALEITLNCDINKLLNDRFENPQYHPVQFLYRKEDSSEISLPAKVKTRGHFRRLKKNCFYPPLWLNFSKSEPLKSSIFRGQDKLKLVMPCRGDEYVIREWLVYKLYNLVTPKSFRARLVKVKLNDTKNKKTSFPFYGMLLEDEKEMAKRNGAFAVNRKIKQEATEPRDFLTMAVFQYLAGNTDWSVPFMHNIKLMTPDSNTICSPVPYDFDHAGLVDAPYAKPAEELNMNTVLERRYRGYCTRNMKEFDGIIALFNRLKKDIYALYSNCPLLDSRYIKNTKRYLDEFYSTINNARLLKKEFAYPCDENGTGNVVIKGLKDD